MLKVRKKLGQMLLEEKLITPQKLDKALEENRSSDVKLGEFLVQKGLIRESDILDMLSRQLGIPRYSPAKNPIASDASTLLPIAMAQKYHMVPLSQSGYLLQVAITDPMDINALDAVEIETNTEVDPLLCTNQELNRLMSAVYGMAAGMGQMLSEIEPADAIAYSGAGPDEQDLSNIQDMIHDAPVVKIVNTILNQAVQENASDIHLSPERDQVQLRFRIDGRLRDIPAPPKSMFLPVISRFKIMANMDIAVSRIPQDGRFSFKMESKEIHVRASIMPTIYGENLVLRLLNTDAEIYSLEALGMNQADRKKIARALRRPYGLILATGPTGSGKSTCLYSLLSMLNRPDANILTLEDPVEYRMPGVRQAQLNRKAGMTFASGLRSILRQDPNIVMVGEIRDPETAAIAIQAGMTGHLVLSTLHTNSAAGAVTRLIDMGIEPFLVSSVLLACIGQRLVRKVCESCKEPYTPPAQALRAFGLENADVSKFMRGSHCLQCGETGYKGRTGIFEVLFIDEAVQELILNRATSREIARTAARTSKFTTMRRDALAKVQQGVTTLEEAASAILV